MNATFGSKQYDNAEDLMSWIESMTDMSATPQPIIDRFEYNIEVGEI